MLFNVSHRLWVRLEREKSAYQVFHEGSLFVVQGTVCAPSCMALSRIFMWRHTLALARMTVSACAAF